MNNLEMLQNWTSKQRFIVVEGKLTVLEGRVNTLMYRVHRKKRQEEVKRVISATIGELTPETKKTLLKTLKPMGEKVYDRGAIPKNCLRETAGAVDEVRLALELGVDFKSIGSGINGSYFGRDRFGKKKVVFKPADEEAMAFTSPKISSRFLKFLAKVFPMFYPFHNLNPELSYKNEAAAYVVDEHLKLGVVPKTTDETFKSEKFAGKNKEKEGSCQEFVEGAILAEEAYSIPKRLPNTWQKLYLKLHRKHLPKVELNKFQEFVLLDYLIGNQDRHLGNFMIDKDHNVVAIDNGYSIPNQKPRGLMGTVDQYTWAYLPEADKPFSKEIKKKFWEMDEDEFFDKVQEVMGEDFTEEKKQEMHDRIKVIQAAMIEGWPISRLGGVQRRQHFPKEYSFELKPI